MYIQLYACLYTLYSIPLTFTPSPHHLSLVFSPSPFLSLPSYSLPFLFFSFFPLPFTFPLPLLSFSPPFSLSSPLLSLLLPSPFPSPFPPPPLLLPSPSLFFLQIKNNFLKKQLKCAGIPFPKTGKKKRSKKPLTEVSIA